MENNTMSTATVPAVFITVPKYVAITPNPLQKIRPSSCSSSSSSNNSLTVLNSSLGAMSPVSSGYSSSGGLTDDGAPKGKKRRLDHLTWEEKIQRKKLKNRVAAQTSRDRKKARMEEMEQEIRELTDKTEILQNKCESLQTINDSLMEKNQKLDIQVDILKQQIIELQQQQEHQKQQQQQQENENQQQQKQQSSNVSAKTNTVETCAGCESILNGSAVSYTDPLPQGSPLMDSQSTLEQLKKSSTMATLWRIIALCLLYKTCSFSTKSSMPENWKNLPKVCLPTSQQTWKKVIERAMTLLPKFKASQSDCLDQWWGPQQNAWNPANIAQQHTQKVTA